MGFLGSAVDAVVADAVRSGLREVREAVRPGARWRSAENKTFLLTAARAQLGVPSRNRRLIQFALEVSSEEAMLARYRKRIALVLGLGILGSSIAGIVIARREMRPLAEITRAAQHITATQLNERISPGAWPKELTELATAFDEMLSRLEESFTRLSQFSADLAHELRTPINNLMGEAEVALARGRTPAEYKLVLESSLEECGRLARMIDSLLFLARTDNAETEVQRTTFELRKETQAVLEFYEAVAEEQAVELSVTGQAMLSADVILFRRALSNLLTNAFKYTPRGGQIIVTIQLMSDATLAVSVADNGAGIICRASSTGFIAPIPRARSTRSKAPAWAWPSLSRSWSCTAAPSPSKVNWAGERSLPFGFQRITLNSRFESRRAGAPGTE